MDIDSTRRLKSLEIQDNETDVVRQMFDWCMPGKVELCSNS